MQSGRAEVLAIPEMAPFPARFAGFLVAVPEAPPAGGSGRDGAAEGILATGAGSAVSGALSVVAAEADAALVDRADA